MLWCATGANDGTVRVWDMNTLTVRWGGGGQVDLAALTHVRSAAALCGTATASLVSSGTRWSRCVRCAGEHARPVTARPGPS